MFFISILLFVVMNTTVLRGVSNYFLRLFAHLIMLPIVAGESPVAKVLRWPGLQMQRLTTRQPDASMLECAIVAMNCALNGLPKHAPRTAEGWAKLKSYRESDPSYVPEPEEAEA